MLVYLFEFIDKNFDWPGAGLFQYISFRAALGMIISLIIAISFGNRIISSLKSLQIGESVRDLGLAGQKEKEGTPTMGGIIIILAIIVPVLLVSKFQNIYILLLLVSVVWMGSVGLADDYIKVFKKSKSGLQSKFKLLGQVLLGLFIGFVMLYHNDIVVRMTFEEAEAGNYKIVRYLDSSSPDASSYVYVKSSLTNVPFLKGNNLDYRKIADLLGDNSDVMVTIIFVPFIVFLITAVSNGSNLTDGLDGLAAGISAIIATTFAIFAYVSSNFQFADYLSILYLPGSEEIVIFCAVFIGACVGFLWWNSYPARVFMGDTGSLTLGSVIATLAIVLRKEILLPLICGIFLIETLSVILQVSYFKYTKRKYGEGRRMFLMSPLHHHYQKQGIHEAKIVTRFWIVGVLLAIVSIVTLKIR